MGSEFSQGHLYVDYFLNSWFHGALMFSPIFSPGEDESVGGKGPSDILTLSTHISPSIG